MNESSRVASLEADISDLRGFERTALAVIESPLTTAHVRAGITHTLSEIRDSIKSAEDEIALTRGY